MERRRPRCGGGVMATERVARKSPSTAGPSGVTLGGDKSVSLEQGGLRVQPKREYVGIELHRRRSVIVRVGEDGEVLACEQVVNDPVAFALAAGVEEGTEVALEATYGWNWAADLLAADGARVHLVHPLGLHWDSRRVKNDRKDATELAQRLRRSDLPEAWIAPPGVRELRELVRYRAKLTALRTSMKAQVHAVMAKCGILPELADMFTPAGQLLLDAMPLEGAYRYRVDSCRDLLDVIDDELELVEGELRGRLAAHRGYRAIQAINHQRGRAGLRGDPGGRDRRRDPLRRRPTPLLVGGADPYPSRVRHQGASRSHHQAGIEPCPLGLCRRRGPLPRRPAHRPDVPAGPAATGDDDRPCRRGPQASHVGLLRAARR